MATPTPQIQFLPGEGYTPGACNIGPWEIRRRRTFAIAGFAAAAVLYVALVALGTPAVFRLVVLLPLWGGMFSWLQARRRFCAGYAVAGRSNFTDSHAGIQAVRDTAAHAADMQAVARMTRDSFLLAAVPAVLLALLPV